MRPLHETFEGWPYLDVPNERADEMARLLHQHRASFGSTCEPTPSKRRFYLSVHALQVVHEHWRDIPTFDFDALPPLANATTAERVALLRWREDAVRAALGGAPLTQVLPGLQPGDGGLVRISDHAENGARP